MFSVSEMEQMGYEHLQMQLFVQNLFDRVAKAERGSKTLRDHMKKQHMLSEIAGINPVQESEPGRENAKESTAIEDERYFTNQESQPTGEQIERCLEHHGYQRRKNAMDNQKFI